MEGILRILCDHAPPRLDALHLMGQTPDNHESVLARAVELARTGRCVALTVMADPPKSCGYIGGTVWESELRRRGVGCDVPIRQLLFPSRGDEPATDTYGEAVAIVANAKREGWQSVGVVAQPLHQIRAFTTVVSVVLQELPDLKVYSLVGHPLPWHETVLHSQGTTRGTRASLITDEMRRLRKYKTKGDLVSPSKILNYLNRRDGIV